MEEFLLTPHPSSVPPLPDDEVERLGELRETGLLDTEPEEIFDRATALALQIAGTSMAVVSLVDDDRQWFKAAIGIDAPELAREHAFCAHAIAAPTELLVVEDARRDPRFASNPLVTGAPHVRFYAGAPLVVSSGHALGTLCVIDREPHHLSDEQLLALRTLADLLASEIDLRLSLRGQREADLRRRLAESRADTMRTFLSIFQDAAVGIVMVEEDGRIIEANRAYGEIVGITEASLVGRSVSGFTHPDDIEDTVAAIRMMVAGLVNQTHLEKRYVREDGELVWVSVSSSCLRGGPGEPKRIISLIQDITDHVVLREQLAHRALFDPLTGVPNRSLFNERLSRSLSRAERDGKYVAVLFLDVDRFKQVNDRLGHVAGDHVLHGVAHRIRVALRPEDLVARLGGDEFAVLAIVNGEAEVLAIAERIHRAMEEPIDAGGESIVVTVSVGVVLSEGSRDGGNQLLRKADLAMYRAKSEGFGRCVVYGDEIDLARNGRLGRPVDQAEVDPVDLLAH